MNKPKQQPTVAEVIAAVQSINPSASVAISAEVWASPNKSNSHVSIWDGEGHYRAKTMQGALELYRSTWKAKHGDTEDSLNAIIPAIAPDSAMDDDGSGFEKTVSEDW